VLARRRLEHFAPLVAPPGFEIAPFHLELARLLEDESKENIVVSLPPGFGKSSWCGIFYPAFYLGHHPQKKVLLASRNLEYALELSDSLRKIIGCEQFQAIFPGVELDTTRKNSPEAWSLRTGIVGERDPTVSVMGIGSAITARHVHLLVIDDPMGGPEDVRTLEQRDNLMLKIVAQLRARLHPGGRCFMAGYPWHHDDPIMRAHSSPGWTAFRRPAILPNGEPLWGSRFPLSLLEEKKAEYGDTMFRVQYLLDPTPPEGFVFKHEWFSYYKSFTEIPRGMQVYQAWDTALKTGETNAYSACVTIGRLGGDYFVLDVFRGRLDLDQLIVEALRLAGVYRPCKIGVEDSGSGIALVHTLRRYYGEDQVVALQPGGKSKVERAYQVTHICHEGQVKLPQGGVFLPEFLDELLMFDRGFFDDQVDAFVWVLILASGDQQAKKRPRVKPELTRGLMSVRPGPWLPRPPHF